MCDLVRFGVEQPIVERDSARIRDPVAKRRCPRVASGVLFGRGLSPLVHRRKDSPARQLFLPIAREGRDRRGEEKHGQAQREAERRPRPCGPAAPAVHLAPRQNLAPQPPDEPQIGQERDSVSPCDEAVVEGQELDLHEEQKEDRRDHERDPCNRPQHPAEGALADVRRPGEKLDERCCSAIAVARCRERGRSRRRSGRAAPHRTASPCRSA